MDKIEKEIMKETKNFAKNNKIHFDGFTETMILNAMREYKSRLFNNSSEFCICGNPSKKGDIHFENFEDLIYICSDCGKKKK